MENKSTAKPIRPIFKFLGMVIIGLGILAAYNSGHPSNTMTSSSSSAGVVAPIGAQSPSPPAVTPVSEAPVAPRHNYQLEEDGQYGYEPAISENDAKAGRQISALMMVRYIGKKDDAYSVEIMDGASKAVFSCKEPCEFIKTKQYFNDIQVKTETVRNVEGTLIWAVMQDARNGMLVVSSKKTSSGNE